MAEPVEPDQRLKTGPMHKLVRSIRSRGLLGTLRWFANGYLSVTRFIVFHRDLRVPCPHVPRNPDAELRRVSVEELRAFRDAAGTLPVEFYCDETSGFTTPYVAFVEGRMAAILWMVFPGEGSRFLDLEDGDVEYNYSAVLPAYRGRRLAEDLLAHAVRSCQEEGRLRRMFAVVSAMNVPQYKQMMNLGFEPVEALAHFLTRRPKASLRWVPADPDA